MQNNETFFFFFGRKTMKEKVHQVRVFRGLETWGGTEMAARNETESLVGGFEGKSQHCRLLACRRWPINSRSDTKGDQWVMDGGLVVQIQLQIIYWLDIRDPVWGSRCLKTDLKTDMEWIARSHSDTNLSPPRQRNRFFFLKKPNMCSVFGAIQPKLSASVISFQTKAARQWFIFRSKMDYY